MNFKEHHMRKFIVAAILFAMAAGCDDRSKPTVPEKRSDVHIEAPGVKIDIQKKER